MPLHPGTTLGPYQVSAKIREGGMGQVWQARDTKLDRDVALTVLPEASGRRHASRPLTRSLRCGDISVLAAWRRW